MANDILNKIVESLENTFFGEDYRKYLDLVSGVIACRSIKSFRQLKINFTSPEIDSIYRACVGPTSDQEVMTQARAEQIFAQIKAIRANSQFI